ncbi:hypothetical protein H3H36_15715 [Duganella sp. FT3S]|uniref:Phage abortive infection protein n=1 Tax=Rugamonas fusca TaxID=2758568 RepID=A0A7W2EJ09_9BURK|nr:putative phage abortive infection protein [Rugamonas fusca]MBA5606803.1 hypothetical protein [Rugamonas fusca]
MKRWFYPMAMLFAVALPFLYYLGFHGFLTWAPDQPDWGSFGSYMSGVAGPLVSAITLMFMVNSFRQQSRTSSANLFLILMSDHVAFVRGLKTEYSGGDGGYVGIEYLKRLWDHIAKSCVDKIHEQNLAIATDENLAEFLPVISTIRGIIEFIDADSGFSAEEKRKYVNLFYSRLSSVEIKLMLAYAQRQDELATLIERYPAVLGLRISEPESEKLLLNHLRNSRR